MPDEKKNQLHSLLAVEPDLKNKSVAILKETVNTFTKKQDHFDGLKKVYTPKDEEGEKIVPEIKGVVTTVAEKITYAIQSTIKSINAELSKEETNASGIVKAELKVGDQSFGEFSAIALLALEKQLVLIRGVYKNIPTLDPTKDWAKDDTEPRAILKTDKFESFRMVKKPKVMTLAPPTDKHPAQVQLVHEDMQIGTWETVYKSGRISPAQKSALLSNIDNLITAVKRARATANQAEVVQVKVGKKFFDFINSGIL